MTSALLGGYHLAFLIGAATIAAGTLLALALLRPSRTRSQLEPVAPAALAHQTPVLTTSEMEREAA